jgi:hypothetical protein
VLRSVPISLRRHDEGEFSRATAIARRGPTKAVAMARAKRIFSNTALRTSTRFGLYTSNMQGGLSP